MADLENLEYTDAFVDRHIGPRENDIQEMADYLGYATLDELITATLPPQIRTNRPLAFGGLDGAAGERGKSEFEVLADLRALASQNQIYRSYIGIPHADITAIDLVL